MGDVVVENPMNIVPPHKRQPPSNSIPNVDSLEGINNDDNDEYSTLKKLQRHLEYVSPSDIACVFANSMPDTSTFKRNTSKTSRGKIIVRRVYLVLRIIRSLKRELVRAQEEIKRIQSVPLVIGQFLEPIDQK